MKCQVLLIFNRVFSLAGYCRMGEDRMFGMTSVRAVNPLTLLLLAAMLLLAGWGLPAAVGEQKINLADGFDYPVGKPDAAGYYKARGLRLRSPQHFGEDWNGRAGGDSDLGDPIFTMGEGIVTFAYDVKSGWGNVVIIRHPYRDPPPDHVQF